MMLWAIPDAVKPASKKRIRDPVGVKQEKS